MALTAEVLETNIDAINRLRTAKSVKDLVRAGSQWAAVNGFDHWVYGIGAPASPRLLGTFPETWIQSACTETHFSDPLLLIAEKSQRPVVWDLHTKSGIPSMLTVTHDRLLKESWEHGLRSGITIPVHSPDGQAGCVFSASNTNPVGSRTRFRQEPLAVLFSIYFQQEVSRILGAHTFAPQHPTLVARELECLNWASCGKTSAEIALILGLAAVTVNYHINNAAKKLGVKGRFQAIQRALKLQLLEA
jgi:DNA-binding CsgD family transcriptional regulator